MSVIICTKLWVIILFVLNYDNDYLYSVMRVNTKLWVIIFTKLWELLFVLNNKCDAKYSKIHRFKIAFGSVNL